MTEESLSVRSLTWRDTTLINICDNSLIGKTLSEGKLKMHISPAYFGGKLVDDSEALKMMKESSIINLAGEKAVQIAVANHLGHKEAIKMIQGVPFLMIYKFGL
ncbi:MAG: DUF424 family protein [Thaumarchaeota archaeon]|nr:DUF424 family protein [Nitrososphaerota archaeon]